MQTDRRTFLATLSSLAGLDLSRLQFAGPPDPITCIQEIGMLPKPTGGTFLWTDGERSTRELAWNATPEELAAAIREAFDGGMPVNDPDAPVT
jgi:hypothetical protein